MPVPHLPVSLKHAGRRLADKNDNDTKMHRLDHLRASAERSQTAQCKVSQNYTRWEITFGWPTSTEWLLAGRLVCSNSVICFNFEDFKHKVILQSLKHAVIHLNECTSNNPWQQWGGGRSWCWSGKSHQTHWHTHKPPGDTIMRRLFDMQEVQLRKCFVSVALF